MTFEEAKRRYIHRFTLEHVPHWATVVTVNGKYYAPQYASDWEWYQNTLFPPLNPLGKRVRSCYSTGMTWPLGLWLEKPYERRSKGTTSQGQKA